MITVLGKFLGLYGPALAAIRVGHARLNGWWMMSSGFDAKKVLRLVNGSRLTVFLGHAVHLISVFPFF